MSLVRFIVFTTDFLPFPDIYFGEESISLDGYIIYKGDVERVGQGKCLPIEGSTTYNDNFSGKRFITLKVLTTIVQGCVEGGKNVRAIDT